MRIKNANVFTTENRFRKLDIEIDERIRNVGILDGEADIDAEALQNVVAFGIKLENAVAAATILSARAIGLQDGIGSIEEGKLADMLLLDSRLSLLGTIIGGKVIRWLSQILQDISGINQYFYVQLRPVMCCLS